ncbi:toxin-activating lysine-acyltransferase [Solimicrobium silvestre]|uniref:RTX toxin-activating lysine-acyltransferase n=1 Tax=Solimicrobium silvestre TaxID=2099400 RepID=A0A2S9GXP5_9BURK|nr:toxin-activating lysine-acyltransferase [Solimicrobium silvestre]PRC92481.1 ACP:hemolysin acyltransferase (hemolysin-activating protein) [Solimicrobium silvestre]
MAVGFDAPSDSLKNRSELFGYALILMRASPAHRDQPLSKLYKIIEAAISHKTIKFYFNEDGNVVACVIWALLAEDVEHRVIQTGEFSLHESEWNEGNSLWIIELLAPFGNMNYVYRALRDSLFLTHQTVRYIRKVGQEVLIKEAVRRPLIVTNSDGI